MIVKTAYEKDTGNLLYSVEGNEGFLVAQDTDDIGFVDGSYDSTTYRVVNGSVVHKSAEEIEAQEIARAWIELKSERNRRLANSDWTQVSDAPVDRAAWAAYRQALRELPDNTPDPFNPVWPVPPS